MTLGQYALFSPIRGAGSKLAYFTDNQLDLKLLGAPNTGFRPGQLGALHSILAHFSVYDEPALLSLPTGYGKTAILMALPFVMRSKRVLVIEPSDALRRQTASHFKELSTLRKLSALRPDAPNPRVLGQKGRPDTAEEWAAFEAYDVVISTPQSISPTLPDAPTGSLFDLIIFDEAHHAPANTWATILSQFPGVHFVFLTATPFRRDRKVIPARIAYWYPVSKASRESAFGKVHFTAAPVVNENDDEETDRSVAQTAVARLLADRDAGFDHRLFARAASIPSARKLVAVYATCGVNVKAIDSHVAKRTQDKIESELLSGELDGVICVDMFGEGYDFPKLKIAALHAPHRSLVPTLQFIGRFARTTDSSTGDATFVAPLSRLRDASVKLFKEGIDIAELIDEVAQQQIAESESERQLVEILKTRKQADSDYDSVTPLLLELYAHAQIFECDTQPDFGMFGDTIGRGLRVAKQWTTDDNLVTLLLTVDTSPPNWATSDVLVNIRHDAFLLAYNVASKLCFIGSTRRTERTYLDLMQTVCANSFRPISFERTRLALQSLSSLRFYNVGLKNTAVNSQAESYRTMTGPAAERAITSGDARAYSQGHFFGSGIGADDERETIGASSSSRIWSNQVLTVSQYLEWISEINSRINSDGAIEASRLDIIQHARTLSRTPENVIGGAWHKDVYRHAPRVRYRVNGDQWNYMQATDLELSRFAVSADRRNLEFDIGSDAFVVRHQFVLGGGALFRLVSGGELEVQTGYDDWIQMPLWLSTHPPVFYAADKSSFQGVNLISPSSLTTSQLGAESAFAIAWDGCAIDDEFGVRTDGLLNVHQALENYLRNTAGIVALLYDHRSGEAADFVVVVRLADDTVQIKLYHCKAAGGSQPTGGRVGDVYEVSGQMLKSVSYCDVEILMRHIAHRINPARPHRSHFIIGDLNAVSGALTTAPPMGTTFEVYAVQPGISLAAVDSHLSDLMTYGVDYVQRGGAVRSAWIVSA